MKKFLFTLFTLSFFTLFAQTSNEPISIYIDCITCDNSLNDILKQELESVSFVRDQKDADVHVFFTTQRNASNGESYEIEFIGKNKYSELNDTLYFDTNADMTELEVSDKILKYLRLGLLRFWIENGLVDKLSVIVEKDIVTDVVDTNDPWNKWSFNIGVSGWFNGEEFSKFSNFRGNISGKQITDKNKFKFHLGISQNKSVFIYGDDEIISDKKSNYFYISDVISINEHLSTGIFASMGSSVYNNYNLYVSLRPGIEYNFFPYSESSKKQLILRYKAGVRYNNYIETTIFNQDNELLWNQSATIGASFKKKWGSVSAEFEYENYLHDMTLDELNLNINTNIRLFKGLSLRLFGGYGITHNQISIPAQGATLEELLLQQKQIRSGYNYYGSVGLNYNFGSIYNTIVNSRFD